MSQELLKLIGNPEGCEIEYKSAKGGLPHSLWESYSSFANANGGLIVLGMKEKGGHPVSDFLTKEQVISYQKQLWDNLHNKDVVNLCLLKDDDIEEVEFQNSWLLVIRVPRARFEQRPVYLARNPFGNTYVRNHEGDYRCTDEEVRLLFAEAESLNNPFDSKILKGYKLEHLDVPTIHAYRNRFNSLHDSHPWRNLPDMDFLQKISAYKVDIEKGEEGFTRAGVLMFGKTDSITNSACTPYFFPDLQEWNILDHGERWSDRICPDGYWEANLYQFFYRAYSKLVQQLPVPFRLEGIQRVDETPAHKSIREALTNTLVHANYMLIGSILIKIEPGRIIMRNPGRMLVSIQEYYAGSRSKCRNPLLQKLFQLIGYGEKAGSGADIIAKGWEENHWERPTISEKIMPGETELVLNLTKDGGINGGKDGGNVMIFELTKIQKDIIDLINTDTSISVDQMAVKMAVKKRTLEREIANMKQKGYISRTGSPRWGQWEIKIPINHGYEIV